MKISMVGKIFQRLVLFLALKFQCLKWLGVKGTWPKGPESKGPRSIRWTDHVSTQSTIGTSEHSFKSVNEGR